ncbi:uncharacterized protein C14orf119 [Diachasmimorpha longicaudata]|uniref:uncharacterized protein C14orf119 n=1 Tax=Diachasmimorpha longicaudata TaxID=58733 RepID=UPI0030B91B53
MNFIEREIICEPLSKYFFNYSKVLSTQNFLFPVNKMSSTNPISNQAQLRYLVEWFQEWSEMQRGDFLGVLIACCGPRDLVNGLVPTIENLNCNEEGARPASLFQCRVKLFREWCQNWSQQDKESLLTSIKNIDPKFAEKYERRLIDGHDHEEETANGFPDCSSPAEATEES